MIEREHNNELEIFRDEIRKIKSYDRTMFAVDDPAKLGERSLQVFNEFKAMIKNNDPDKLYDQCEVLAKRSFEYGSIGSSNDESEFFAWLRNKLAAIKTFAALVRNGNMSNEEFNEEYNLVKESIFK